MQLQTPGQHQGRLITFWPLVVPARLFLIPPLEPPLSESPSALPSRCPEGLLGVGLGDVRDVQNQKRPLADPGAPFAQDSAAHVSAQLLAPVLIAEGAIHAEPPSFATACRC